MNNSASAPSFNEIRKILKELSVSQKETDRQIKKLSVGQKETNQQIKELFADQKETWRQIKETDRQIAENNKGLKSARNLFETQWGRLVESLVEGKLLRLLNERGIEVRHLAQRIQAGYKKEDGQTFNREFDIIAVNGNEAVAVEVKTALTPEKVTYFMESLKDFKKYFPLYGRLTVYGAVAYLRSESEAQIFAQRQGLFVIRATGDSAGIINTKDFKPKIFA